MVDLSELKVGDTVKFRGRSSLKVQNISVRDSDCTYPYTVTFENEEKIQYTKEGAFFSFGNHDGRDIVEIIPQSKEDPDKPKVDCKGERKITKKIEAAVKNGTIKYKIEKLEAHKREIEAKIKECKEALERSKKPKLAIPFMPEDDERFYSYTIEGNVGNVSFYKESTLHNCIAEIGHCFMTENEAKLAREKRCAETELLMMCDGLDLKEKAHFVPCFVEEKKWSIDSWYKYTLCPYRFASRESCQAAIDKLGDRKLRLIFNIPLED